MEVLKIEILKNCLRMEFKKKIIWELNFLKIKFVNRNFGKLFENWSFENWNFEKLFENEIFKNYVRIIWEWDCLKIKFLKDESFLISKDELRGWHMAWGVVLEGDHALVKIWLPLFPCKANLVVPMNLGAHWLSRGHLNMH